MHLLQLIIQNFSSIKDAKLNLVDRGLVVIEGETYGDGASSNGSGKSSVINAILWCNYGDAGKKLDSVDDVVNWKVGKDCSVSCLWKDEDLGIHYRITRYRKHSVFKNIVTVESVTADGEMIANLTKGTDGETQKLINVILGCDQSTFEAKCFARQSNAPDIPGMTDAKLKALLESVLPFESLDGYYKKAQAKVSAQKVIEQNLANQAYLTSRSIENRKKDREAEEFLMKDWARNVSKKLSALETQLDELSVNIKLNRDAIKPQETIDKAKKKYKDIIDGFDQVGYMKATTERGIAYKELTAAQKELAEIDKKSSCGTCGQDIKDFPRLKELAVERADIALLNFNTAQVALSEFNDPLDKYTTAKGLYEKVLGVEVANNKRQSTLEFLEDRYSATAAESEREPPNPHIASVKRLKAEIEASETELLTLQASHEEAKAKLLVLEGVAETFSPKGIRYHMLETITPALNARTNYYLKQLTDGAYQATWSTVTKLKSGDYKEKFSITVSGAGHKSYGSLSGGEQRKVRLACFFALQDVIGSRATKSINLWIGDEIDHALDTAGLERLIGLLHEKTATQSTILVISHNDLSGWIPNRIKVTKEHGITTVIDKTGS